MRQPFQPRAHVLGMVLAAGLLAVLACRDDATEPMPAEGAEPGVGVAERGGAAAEDGAASADAAVSADTVELGRLLAEVDAAQTLAAADRQTLEQVLERLLRTAAAGACDGCQPDVTYVDETGGGDYFRCELRPSGGDAVADLHVFHRPGLPLEAPASWSRSSLAGHPASGLAGDHLFVWPGRFEIRAFARADPLRSEERLERLLASLPLDELARL